MRRGDLRYNPDLAIVPSQRDRDAAAMEAMTVPELRALAAAGAVDLTGLSRKDDIVAALQTSPDLGEQTQPTHDDPQGSEPEKETH